MSAPVTHLATISLAELVADAHLQARVDRKYLVPEAALTPLLTGLPDGTRVLEIAGARTFAYRSVYLDTPDLRSYLSAGRGHRMRFKVRSRSYVDTGGTYLEVKTRAARGLTVKHRVAYTDDTPAGLNLVGQDFVAGVLEGHGVAPEEVAWLRPALVSRYRRTTLHLPGMPGRPASRGTIDTKLVLAEPGPGGRSFAAAGLAVVETKGGSTPSALDRRMWRLGHRPVVLSKYGTGLAAVRDDLPPLKWHHTLDRHLRRTTPRSA